MSAIEHSTKPHLLASAAELLVHRARLRLAAFLGEAVDDAMPLDVLEHRLSGPEGHAWARLVGVFGLSTPEADLLALALAVAIEPSLGPLVARAQGSEGRLLPTEPLIKAMHGHGARPIWRPTAALAMWRLVLPVPGRPGEPDMYRADRSLVDWMFGTVSLDAELVLAVDQATNGMVPAEWPVEAVARRMVKAIETSSAIRVVLQGREGSGRRSFGAAVAQGLDSEALVVDAKLLPTQDWAENFMLSQRFALFSNAALIWIGIDQNWPAKIPMAPLQFICADPGQTIAQRDGTNDIYLPLPNPGIDSKAQILAEANPQLAAASADLAAMPGLLFGDLKGIAPTQSAEEASSDLRAKARARMQGAGHVVDPEFGWDDLVAPHQLIEQLRRISFEARMRPKLMENPETARLYRRSAGLSALFSGPPGVGKSMAAQVIARELGANLLIVDLASTTSKFIGETAKNLTEAFAQAQASGAALIFEEADAFFAKRTDVSSSNDRYANSDTNHLLQLLEAHEGLVLLSTNRRANIDPAFIRRLRHVVEFPKPGAAERKTLWLRMIAGLGISAAPLLNEIAEIAKEFDLSPAQIKGAALSALYSALEQDRPIAKADLRKACQVEMSKEGRAAPANPAKRNRQRSPRHG